MGVSGALTVTSLLLGLVAWGEAGPPAEYAAEQTTQIGATTTVSKIYVQGEKTRSETHQQAQGAVTIMRRDKGRVWILWPGMHAYIEQTIPPGDPRLEPDPNAKEEREVVGRERVGRYGTDKIKVTTKNLHGDPLVHYEWHAKSLGGLVVRRKSDIGQVELRDVVVGPQPAELFEIPPGYRPVSIRPPSPPSK